MSMESILLVALGGLVVAGVIVLAVWTMRRRRRGGDQQRELRSLQERLKAAEVANQNLAKAYASIIDAWGAQPMAPDDVKELRNRLRSQAPESRASSSPIRNR